MKPRVNRSKSFKDWYQDLSSKDQGIVDTRIDTYRDTGNLVRSKLLNKDFALYEFKWDSGLRVYFSMIEDNDGNLMLLLVGGNKNTQSKDIAQAKKIVLEAVTSIKSKGKKASKVIVPKGKRHE